MASNPGLFPSIIATAILSLTLGYWIGVGHSLYPTTRPSAKGKRNHDRIATTSSDMSSEEDDLDTPPQAPSGLPSEECKLVLVVRTDLGMGKGKAAAQCSHATLACYKSAIKHHPELVRRWEYSGQPKVTVQAKSEEELEVLQGIAVSLGLTAKVICDAGRTQIVAGSKTVLGVGPGPKSVVDQVTGGLKLY